MNHVELIEKTRHAELQPCIDSSDPYEWARFGFHVAIKILFEVRSQRFSFFSLENKIKDDGSPVTAFEKEIEFMIKEKLIGFSSEANFYGEELGSTDPDKDITVAVDPIDGTWSFISGFDSYTVTLSIARGTESLFSLIALPSTGDIGYRIGNEQSMIFQFPIDSTQIQPIKLPLIKEPNKVLVNIHPSRNSLPIVQIMHKKWDDRTISLVKSVSGSPALQILETAKTGSIYINNWDRRHAEPFDLLSAIHILNGAGGMVVTIDGEEVNPDGHKGLLICGIDKNQLKQVLDILKSH